MGIHFPAIIHSITIRIGRLGIGAQLIFPQVRQVVAIRIRGRVVDQWIGSFFHLPLVGHTISVGVRIQGIGVVNIHLGSIGQSIPIRIRIVRISARLIFLKIGEPVVVGIEGGIIDERIESMRNFPAIRHAIPIRVSRFWIGAQLIFLQVGEPVVIRVGIGISRERIGSHGNFPLIRQTILISVASVRVGAV